MGAIVGGVLFSAFGMQGITGLNIWSMIVAVVGSVVVLWGYHALASRRDALPRAYLKNRREDRCLDIGWFLPATVAVDAAAHGETPGAVLRFCAALRYPECKVLAGELTLVEFERGGAREEEMTYAQATAFIRKALEMGRAGVIPADRALSMGIGVAAQFELLLRQKDTIGDWGGPNGEKWTGYFTWENIPVWRPMKTSKSKSVRRPILTWSATRCCHHSSRWCRTTSAWARS